MHAANVGENCEWPKVELGISTLQQMGTGCFVMQKVSSLPENSHKPQSPESPQVTPISKNTASVPESKPTQYSAQSVMSTIQRVLSKEGFAAVLPYLENKTTLYLSDTGM